MLVAGRCGHMTNYILVLHMRSMYKIDRRGRERGGQKSFSRKLPLSYLLAITKIGIQVYVSRVEFKLFYSKKVSKVSAHFEKFVLQFLGAMKIKLSLIGRSSSYIPSNHLKEIVLQLDYLHCLHSYTMFTNF